MNAPEIFVLNMTRFIRAPRERVFDAFVDAAQLQQWHCPRGMKVAACSSDARAGGAWQLEMLSREGSRFTVGGSYVELQRPVRLAYTWEWRNSPMAGQPTLVELELSEQDGGTLLTLRHSGFPAAGARDAHGQGWQSTLTRLTELLDPRGSAATLTLLGVPASTYTRSVRMGLAEKGVAYTLEPARPHSPEVDAVHPFGRIPALRDGELALWETSAILHYLDEAFEGPGGLRLTPDTILGRARCEQWVSAVNCYLYDTIARRYVLQYIFPRGEGGQPDRAVIDGALKEIPQQLAALERGYGTGEFLAGGALSFADLFVAPILAYLEHMPEGRALLEPVPAVRRAMAAIQRRDSFTTTQPPRG